MGLKLTGVCDHCQVQERPGEKMENALTFLRGGLASSGPGPSLLSGVIIESHEPLQSPSFLTPSTYASC